MKILMTDARPDLFGGAEIAASDLASALGRRGHSVVAFSARIGTSAPSTQGFSVPVVRDLADLDFRPDIIHGQHHFDAMIAVASLPGVPAVFHCHGAGFYDTQPKHPRIYRYLAMSATLALRLTVESGIPRSHVQVIHNAVDLDRFTFAREPAPLPSRALLYGNTIRPESAVARVVREAVAARGLSLDQIGRRAGRVIPDPERVLPHYDIVFAAGKSAIDALACGCSVIVLGMQGCGEMVDRENFARLRAANFSIAVNSPEPSAAHVLAEIDRYDPGSSRDVTERLRREADLRLTAAAVEQIYDAVIDAHARTQADAVADQRALTSYLRRLVPMANMLDQGRVGRHLAPLLRGDLDRSVAESAAFLGSLNAAADAATDPDREPASQVSSCAEAAGKPMRA